MLRVMRVVGLLSLGLAWSTHAADPPDDPKAKAKIAALEKEIVEQKNKLAALQAELARLKPAPAEAVTFLKLHRPSVGDSGFLDPGPGRPPKIVKILDDATILLVVGSETADPLAVLVKLPTKGLAEDRVLDDAKVLAGLWKCTRSEKYQGKTHYVIEPVAPPKK